MQKFLITAALPYANGPLHVGHIAGAYLPADIYVRFLRQTEKVVLFIGGTDEHGVPITLAAEKEKIPPQEYVAKKHDQIKRTFEQLAISFDNFSGTARPLHYETTTDFFSILEKKGHLAKKTTMQLYCPQDERFLPDRYVEGTCPKCHASGARGDQCENCGSDLDQTQLIAPYCKICGSTPVLKETFHWFLRLSAFEPALKKWLETKKGIWKDNVINFCSGLLSQGLPDRAITRDMKWGVPVPNESGKGKVIYVWFDAPIGYISATKEWAINQGSPDAWKSYWQNPDCKIVHFIGKDNIVFHSIMWPAILMGVEGFSLPDQIPANEFLNLEGQKVSTSRGFAIWVHEFLESFSPDALRYYLATISPETRDTDFFLRDFQAVYNGDLADNMGNLINRVCTFTAKYFDSKIPAPAQQDRETGALLEKIGTTRAEMENAFAQFQVRRATGKLMELCRAANKYFNDREPWKTRKTDLSQCGASLNACLCVVRALGILAEPLIPFSAKKIQAIFSDQTPLTWKTLESTLLAGAPIEAPPILFAKIKDETIQPHLQKLKAMTT